MTSTTQLKITRLLLELFDSYQSQFKCLFGHIVLTYRGNRIVASSVFYCSKDDIMLNFLHLAQFIRIISSKSFFSSQAWDKTSTRIGIALSMSRITSPVLDSQILATYLLNITNKYTFQQMCSIITKRIMLTSLDDVGYISRQPQGLIIKLHGRAPREAVRPRKTVQAKMLGINTNTIHVYAKENGVKYAQRTNPELGTFSLWVSSIC